MGNNAAAEASFVAAQRVADELDDKRLLARLANSRGIISVHQKNYAQGAEFYRAGLALAVQAEETEVHLQILNNYAVMLTAQGDLDGARPLLEENLRVHTAANNRRSIANALINLGTVEGTAGNHASALDDYQRALAIRLELGVARNIAGVRISIASTLTRLGRAAEALTHLRTAADLSGKISSHELAGNLHRAFSDTYAALGDFREALAAQQQAEKENAFVAGEKTAATIAELRERFDAEKRERELTELRLSQSRKDADLAGKEADLHRSQLERYGLAALLVLGGITVTAIISRQRATARAEHLILEETRRARDAAEQANKLKSQLLDLASHDLKSPLIHVMHTADNLLEEARDPDAVARRARGLRHESQRMFDLVQNLLDTSAIESGQRMLLPRPTDLSALVRETLPALEERLARKHQRFVLDADPVCPLEGDALRLRQVFENLVDNASKFSPLASVVHVTVRGGATARLAVRDQGPGLTEADRKNLFQPKSDS